MNASTFLSHVAVAFLCGLVIGLERQWRQHPAGLRTNALISLGASLFASLAILFEQESSPTRVAGQIVTGIGFLGGGVILRDGFRRATFLPQVWEKIPDPADFLSNLCLKMGASANAWRIKPMEVLTYEVEEFHE